MHGGKYLLSSWIIQHFPENYQEMTYCEPFCGGSSVFLNKEPSTEEILSDTQRGITCVFKALRDEPQEFTTRLKRTRYTERAFKMALNREEKGFEDYVDHAVNEFILRRMSRGGLKKSFDDSQLEDASSWTKSTNLLPLIAKRMPNSIILCHDFREVIKTWDDINVLFYIDPPYLNSTNTFDDTEQEMTVEDHMDLLQILKSIRGKVILSGYSSPLYNRNLQENWTCEEKQSNKSENNSRRVECIWKNF